MRPFPTNLVHGYHGTSDVHVPSILRDGFTRSRRRWDWLGNAVYFWEGDADRAAEWAPTAVERDGGNPVVIRVVIDLSKCFDLTLQRYRKSLREVAELVIAEMSDEQLSAMRQTDGRRELDCHILNSLFETARNADGSPTFTTVRGAFREGRPLFSVGEMYSGIHEQDHLQIGVLDQSAIEDVEITYL